MADDTAPQDDTQDTAPDHDAPAKGEDALGDAGKKALDLMKAERTEAVKRAKALERELEQVRTANLSEAERAVAEAEARGRASALTDMGKRLARSEFATVAARRNAEFDTAGALELLDLSRFVGDDGEPNVTAITSAVERLVPLPDSRPPSFDGGVRGAAGPLSDLQQIEADLRTNRRK